MTLRSTDAPRTINVAQPLLGTNGTLPWQPSSIGQPSEGEGGLGAEIGPVRHFSRLQLAEGFSHFVTLYGAFFVKSSNLAPMFFSLCGTGSGHLPGARDFVTIRGGTRHRARRPAAI